MPIYPPINPPPSFSLRSLLVSGLAQALVAAQICPMPAWCAAWSCRVRSQLCYCGASNRAAFSPNHDPTVPPPPYLGQGRSASGNHCFAQIIKKSGCLCLTLDIRAVCAFGAASLVFAEDHVYGGPR